MRSRATTWTSSAYRSTTPPTWRGSTSHTDSSWTGRQRLCFYSPFFFLLFFRCDVSCVYNKLQPLLVSSVKLRPVSPRCGFQLQRILCQSKCCRAQHAAFLVIAVVVVVVHTGLLLPFTSPLAAAAAATQKNSSGSLCAYPQLLLWGFCIYAP